MTTTATHRRARRTAGEHPARRRLGVYTETDSGAAREILSLPAAGGSILVVDHAATRADARLVGHLAADEPLENADILAALYLDDPSRGRCRRVRSEDLGDAPYRDERSDASAEPPPAEPLVDAAGFLYRLRAVQRQGRPPELRWTRCRPGAPESFDALSLRDVVARLQDYEPACTLTAHALAGVDHDPPVSLTRLRAELDRVMASPIVLNRHLRQAVLARVARGESMSEIAMRCGRIKRDQRGNASGETSWLARRIGHMPEGGEAEPTPWIHSDVLALIARDGLGTSPLEVEAA
ncbi:MAG: hypothetical protein ACHQAV_02740 [Solirubrobacterales bacterium]